jgi:hypothetical protein
MSENRRRGGRRAQ